MYNVSPEVVATYHDSLEAIALMVAGATDSPLALSPVPGCSTTQLAYAIREALVAADVYPSERYHKGLAKRVRISINYEQDVIEVKRKGTRGKPPVIHQTLYTSMRLMSFLIQTESKQLTCSLIEEPDEDHENILQAIKALGWNVEETSSGVASSKGVIWELKLRRSERKALDVPDKQSAPPERSAFDILDAYKGDSTP